MKKLLLLIAVMLAAVLAVGGCGADKTAGQQSSGKIVLRYPEALQKYGFKEPLVLDKIPQRVVSLAHTPVLALYEMGVNQVAVPQNKMFSWPDELAKNAQELNTAMNDNFDIESIVALQPDLVILGYHAKDSYGKILENEKIPVYYVDAGHVVTYKSVKELTDVLIEAFGKDNAGADKIKECFDNLEARMEGIRKENAGKKVMVLQSAPPRHFIQNKEGTLGSMADMLGYDNVYKNTESSLALLDREQALGYEPDLLLCVGGSATAEEHQQLMEEDFAKNPDYWNSIKAIREGHVIYLPVGYIASGGIEIVDRINSLIDMLETAEK